MKTLEEVFVTEGTPEFTFVQPPNYNDILIDIRRSGKPVIIEGQSGTGKTTTAKKIISQLSSDLQIKYVTARQPADLGKIKILADDRPAGFFIVDDFHRLDSGLQSNLADLAKYAAETQDVTLPKLILIGINQVGSSLIHLVPDLAKRCGIHKVQSGDLSTIDNLIKKGSEELNVSIRNPQRIFTESRGDYWLTQLICQAICAQNGILKAQDNVKVIDFDEANLRAAIVTRLSHSYKESIKDFVKGRRFRPSNDPYYKLLRLIGGQESSIVDLNELANAHEDMRASINGIKERRLAILLDSKPNCSKYFFYNAESKSFAIEDPALFYYIRNLNWDEIRKECGFRDIERTPEFEAAISFAGENRILARFIADQLEALDITVFYDEYYEANFLGRAWSKEFERIFVKDSKLVVCLLDRYHRDKIWPTFERECFRRRVSSADVIPIYLDDTLFPGIPEDIAGIRYQWNDGNSTWESEVADNIVYKIWERLE